MNGTYRFSSNCAVDLVLIRNRYIDWQYPCPTTLNQPLPILLSTDFPNKVV